ncbi:hypothetical protein [Cohnella fermenti]|uniref:Uncharacterized protein n=1 Tax=Cohnella fermenti TaxID=2565925 RepID=A0A4S4C844_9BACL|nr:hypothetical protein [Cohnella fermenti]THF83814.1 hypothetical protein E6C55_03795 [Cohnella fermenti]
MRKLRIMLLVCLCVMMIGVQSAFATTGQYDGPATANPVTKGSNYFGYIDSASDNDWYVFENTGTTSSSPIYPRLISPISTDLDAQLIWITPTGFSSSTFTTGGIGGVDNLGGYAISPGSIIYIRVYPHTSADVSTTDSYILTIG